MPLSIQEIAGVIAFALATALLLLPLAKRLPADMERQWNEDVEADLKAKLTLQDGADRFSLSLTESMWIVGAGLMLGALVMVRHGFSPTGAAWSLYFWALLLLTVINLKHSLLPDKVVLTTLWIGLLFHTHAGQATEHVYGAAVAFVGPWLLALTIKRVTGAFVIGYGDFKTFAMAGAWFGLEAVPGLLMFFLLGVVVSMVAPPLLRRRPSGVVPSGPAHLFASIVLACSPYLRPLIE